MRRAPCTDRPAGLLRLGLAPEFEQPRQYGAQEAHHDRADQCGPEPGDVEAPAEGADEIEDQSVGEDREARATRGRR